MEVCESTTCSVWLSPYILSLKKYGVSHSAVNGFLCDLLTFMQLLFHFDVIIINFNELLFIYLIFIIYFYFLKGNV